MIKLNCPNCKKRRTFLTEDSNEYKCKSCNKCFKQCKGKDCLNFISYGFYCEKCVGKTIKNGGSVAGAVVLATGALAFKLLRKGK